jgi:hypothetical protein
VHQRAQRHGAVHAAAGDDDLRALVQRALSHRQRAQVGVGRDHLGRQRRAALQLAHSSPRSAGTSGITSSPSTTAMLHATPCSASAWRDGVCAGLRVDAAGVADDADVAGHHVFQDGFMVTVTKSVA